ncbi:hypothetical protein H8356DRAFT_1358126 [Neocallimastix lanati (nom. inval.)]|nr:hypothetical protein H8356DRAFT_1324802 [Neocallimastix sp. JGI-2020a]KAG4084085.1 hypothetical protein H8356DRAFT_1358126 [Neocallimastix sp. JGI-2020a]
MRYTTSLPINDQFRASRTACREGYKTQATPASKVRTNSHYIPRGLRRRAYKRVPLMQREDRGSSINDESRGEILVDDTTPHVTSRLMIKYYLVKSIESTVAESVDAEMMKKFDKNLLITPILKLLLAIMNVVLSFEE